MEHSGCKECSTERLDIPTFPLPRQNRAEHHGIIVDHHLAANESEVFQVIYLQLEPPSHQKMIPPLSEF